MNLAGKGKWDSYRGDEAKEAIDAASEFISPVPEKKETRIQPAGNKRKERELSDRPPLPGCTAEQSEKIRHIVGYKMTGRTQKEAFEALGWDVVKGTNFIRNRRDAIAAAEKEILEICLQQYQHNLWIVRTALSEIGPRAVRTLATIMDDPKVSAGIRSKVATTILKMVDVDHSATGGNQESLAKEFVSFIKETKKELRSETIVDAEDAEVLEDGGDRTDD